MTEIKMISQGNTKLGDNKRARRKTVSVGATLKLKESSLLTVDNKYD